MYDENKRIIESVIENMINLQILCERNEGFNFEVSLEALIVALKYTLDDH